MTFHTKHHFFPMLVWAFSLCGASAHAQPSWLPPITSLLFDESSIAVERTVVISSNLPSTVNSDMILIIVKFTEPTSGLEEADFIVENGSLSNLMQSDSLTYSATITASSPGLVSVLLPPGAVTYNDGSITPASNQFSITYDPSEVEVYLEQNFDDLNDGNGWPAPWVVAEESPVVRHYIDNGQACLEGLVLAEGMPGSGEENLARMVTTGLDIANFEATFQIVMDDAENQGVGFYGLQNGGFFTLSEPAGEGYVVFLRGFLGHAFTLWYEDDGDEVLHQVFNAPDIPSIGDRFEDSVYYNVRYQVEYLGEEVGTIQRARIWLEGEEEPAGWYVSDSEGFQFPEINPMTIPSLQGITGGFAVDLYNFAQPSEEGAETGTACIDNLRITNIVTAPNPLELSPPPSLISNEFAPKVPFGYFRYLPVDFTLAPPAPHPIADFSARVW